MVIESRLICTVELRTVLNCVLKEIGGSHGRFEVLSLVELA
jgi:hypothetical protein